MKIKNLIVVSDFGYINGGNSKVAIQTALALKDSDIDVYFFCGADPIEDELLESNIKIKCLKQKDFYEGNGRIKGALQGIWNRRAEKEFQNSYKDLDKDRTIVHFHSWSRVLSSSVIRAAVRMHLKIFITLHDYNLFCPNGSLFIFPENKICRYRPLGRQCIFCNCDRRRYIHKLYRVLRFLGQCYAFSNSTEYSVITISNQNDLLCKRYIGRNRRIKYIPNPTDTNLPVRVRAEKNKNFLFIGRISDEKGIRLFCEAITQRGYSGIVLGDGYLLKELKSKYPNIFFAGWCKKEEIIKYIQQARALIFPSFWYEGAPLVIMEMMQYGIPCVVSDISSAAEAVEDGKNGYIFASGDINALMKAMDKIISNNQLEQLSENAQDSFLARSVNMEMYKKELVEFYMT